MTGSEKIWYQKFRLHPASLLDRFTVFFIRLFANYFWIVVDIFSYHNASIASWYHRSIGKEYHRECESFGIKKDIKILHIGCGSYPLTELCLAQNSAVHVVGIDKNKRAVNRAREVVKRHHLEKKITIKQAHGSFFPVESFDVIIVSSCALPKLEIMRHLFSSTKKHAKIIVRDMDIAVQHIRKTIEEYPSMVLNREVHHLAPFRLIGWTAFYMQKK